MLKTLRYTASLTAAALLIIGSAGTAFADRDEDEGEDEGEDDDHGGGNSCNSNSVKTRSENEATKSADVVAARKNFSKLSDSLSTARSQLAVMQRYPKKYTTSQTSSQQSKVDSLTKQTSAAQATYNQVFKSVEVKIENRYRKQCGLPQIATPTPTPTPTPKPTVTPTPTPTPTATKVPAVPSGLASSTASSLDNGAFRLTWDAVTGATSYKVFRDGTLLGTTTVANYTPENITNGRNSYTVVAVNSAGSSAASNALNAGRFAGSTVASKKGFTNYGNVQVFIAVTGQKMTGCWATYPTSGDSAGINLVAIPKLCQSAISSQSANVGSVSGASSTTTAFKSSLQSALTAAGI